jgi:MFS family permease
MAPRALAPFRHRAFTLVWLGALVSNIGTWMETTALSFHVAETADVRASGLVAAAGFLPTAVLSPVGGAWADRFDRRRIMMCTNSISAVIAAVVALLVASGHGTPGWLALCSLLGGCTMAIGFPSFQATLPDLVPADDLVGAIGLSSTQWNLGRILGPTAAAVAISLGDVATALWVNAASFLAVVAAISLARIPRRVGVRRSVLQAARDGVSFARTTPAVRAMVPIMAVTVFVGAPFLGFVAQMATNVLGRAQGGTSLLVTCQGVGAVAAGAAMGSLSSRWGVRTVMAGAAVLLAPCLVWYGSSPSIWVAAVAMVATGACYMAALSSFTSITQQAAPAELRGRAMVVNNFLLGAAYPLGLLVQGAIADSTSLRVVTVGSGVVLAVSALALRLLRPGHTDPIAVLTAAGTPTPA